jgi:hypothetical protein
MTTYQYSFEIGSTSTTTNLEALTTPVNPPICNFTEWTRIYDKLDASVGADGYPACTWHFPLLTQAMVTQLRTFCSGKSANVYIKTRRSDGTFVKYSAVMIWPDNQLQRRVQMGRYLDLEIQFRKLVAA